MSLAVIVSPWFWISGNVGNFWMLKPNFVSMIYKFLYSVLQIFYAIDMNSVEPFD